ncbi:MAG: glycine/sarcosine/betaine reductase component B subunit [Oscillospiraceae bacterium]
MKLTVESVKVRDIQFADETRLDDGVMYVNKGDILKLLENEPYIDDVKIDIARPGDRTRIINVVDVLEPRCKVSGGIDWPGVLSDDYEIAGKGVSRTVQGMGIVLTQNNCYWSKYWGAIDMFGPYSDCSPYPNIPELVLEPIAPNADFRQYREAVRRIAFAAGVLIARATLAHPAESVEVFDNSTRDPALPNVAYSYQIYSKQYDTENYREPMFYGNAVPDTLPLVVQPTEILDGAIASCGGHRTMITYEVTNHPIITELFRRHGKDLNFVGVIITVTAVESQRRHLAAKMAANIMKEEFHADGMIVTKGHGGASTICVGVIAAECEKLGIKAVPVIQVLNAQSNLATECLFDDPEVDSIVQTGCYFYEYDLPAVDTVLGGAFDAPYITNTTSVGGVDIIPDTPITPANGPIPTVSYKQVGITSQIGGGFMKAVDY